MEMSGKNNKRTEVSEIGKMALTEQLLSQIGNSISSSQSNTADEDYIWNTSHTLLMEGADFDLIYMPLKYLGYKAVILCLGNHYARLFSPDNISIRAGFSAKYSAEEITELWSGMVAAINEHNISNVSLELLPSFTGLTLSLSSQGKQKKAHFVQRPEPSSGDLICLTGNLGAAYMGLQILEREKALFNSTYAQPDLEKYKYILKAYLNPEINTSVFEEMERAGVIPSTGEFLRSGLADAVKMLCHTTGFGAKIFLDRLPLAMQTTEAAEELNIDSVTAALNGGNDVQFIFAVPVKLYDTLVKELPQLDIIGHLCDPSAGAVLITPDGNVIELKAQAWSKRVS